MHHGEVGIAYARGYGHIGKILRVLTGERLCARVRVCVCARVRVCACVRLSASACTCVYVCASVCACVRV